MSKISATYTGEQGKRCCQAYVSNYILLEFEIKHKKHSYFKKSRKIMRYVIDSVLGFIDLTILLRFRTFLIVAGRRVFEVSVLSGKRWYPTFHTIFITAAIAQNCVHPVTAILLLLTDRCDWLGPVVSTRIAERWLSSK